MYYLALASVRKVVVKSFFHQAYCNLMYANFYFKNVHLFDWMINFYVPEWNYIYI